MELDGAGKKDVLSDPQPGPEPTNDPEIEVVAGDGIAQQAVDAAVQESETPEDVTNEG